MIVGDFLDAMGGYNEGENERVKSIAELIRRSTTFLVNTQPIKGGPLMPQELWPFPWDKEISGKIEVVSDEELKRRQDAQDEYLLTHFLN
jgi:hypothetical protein